MATHGDIGLAEPGGSSNTAKLDAISLNINSTVVFREVLVIGDPESSVAIARASSVVPKSTDVGLNVRIISGPSTATDFAVRSLLSSTNTDNPVRAILPTTNTDNVIRAFQGPGISTAGDAWKVGPGDTNWASSAGFHVTSSGALRIAGNKSSNATDYLSVRLTDGAAFIGSAADYTALSTMNASTIVAPGVLIRSGAAIPGTTDTWQIQYGTSNGAAYVTPISSTGEAMTSTGVVGSTFAAANVRIAMPAVSNYVKSTALDQSTSETIASSNAATKPYVFGYSITSTKGTNYPVGFYDGATLRWVVNVSSGYGGANLAVTPPAYLFAGSTGSLLTVQTPSSLTAGGAAICVSYFTGA